MTYVLGLDHVQLAMPRGQEDRARAFYADILGLTEIPKPSATVGRGGIWFECGQLQLHLGIEDPFQPARKAHPALRIRAYEELLEKLVASGFQVIHDSTLPGISRAFVFDPFGNRVELVRVEGAA